MFFIVDDYLFLEYLYLIKALTAGVRIHISDCIYFNFPLNIVIVILIVVVIFKEKCCTVILFY